MYSPARLVLFVCIITALDVNAITVLHNVECAATGQYCNKMNSVLSSSQCDTKENCIDCKKCSTNAKIKKDCVWKAYSDTRTCTCNTGYNENPDGSTCCRICTPNAKQTAACQPCTCNAGYYMSSSDSTCHQCPLNSYVATTGSTVVTQCLCSAGYYMHPIEFTCYPCINTPDNAIINNPCSSFTCNTGYFMMTQVYPTVQQFCARVLTCSANSYMYAGGGADQYCYCNSGFYSMPHTTWPSTRDSRGNVATYQYRENTCIPCTVCSAGGTSSGTCTAEEFTDKTCTCNAGYYGSYSGTNISQPICSGCTPGSFTSTMGATVCEQCPAGTFGGPLECISCIPGTYSGNASSTCSSCNPGFFSYIPEASACNACPSGSYSHRSASLACLTCDAGTYSTRNASTCTSCPPGKISLTEASTCMECSSGTYQSSYGASQCGDCSASLTFARWNGSDTCQRCTICNLADEYYYQSRCDVENNAICHRCATCQLGEYMTADCTEDSNRACPVCPLCPNGTYLKSGCIHGLPPVCQTCSTCIGHVLAECTPIDDTVCSFNADCHAKTSSFRMYSWMTDGSVPASKFDGCTKGQYIYDLNPLVCKECPAWLYGPNGLWCEPCKGYTEPYPDQSSCVCISPSVIKSGDVCECDVGFFVDYQGCQPCGAGTFKNFSVVLEDNWWDQDVPCLPCPYGSWSFGQSSSCFSCLPGQYRANESLLGCESCESGFYALDATRSDSCVACSTSCHPGFSQVPCPLYDLPDRFLCVECDPLPTNANWTVDCYYDCNTGFFKFNDTCVPCSSQDCPIGFTKQVCTLYADINCDVPCINETKPLFSSVWDKECSWACEKGYIATALDYGMWTQYECIEESTKPFWLW